jgi:MoxR-like ATPase
MTESVKVTPTAQRDPSGLLHFPVRSTTEHIAMSKADRDVLEGYWAKHIGGEQSIVALVGPSGTGKTSLIWDLAADKQVGLFMFDAAGASSFTDWTGTTVLRQGEGSPVTEFITSSFIEVCRLDGPCAGRPRIVGIDELNRAESGGALNALLPMLAQGRLFIPELGATIIIDPMVFFAFTLNRGSAYNATLTLDAALADRVQAWVMLDFLTEAEEIKLMQDRTGITAADAKRLVDAAKQVREIADRGELQHSISTRRTLDAARAVTKAGLSLEHAAMYCWANSYLDEGGKESDRGRVLTAIHASLGTASTDETPW